ncbi:MAG: hypothetical protein DWQ05_15850 [Calditrichaeota bacterium]|nr:MAG: hypothetical protein DWQ05_15850 [Calditrichota bacterium]
MRRFYSLFLIVIAAALLIGCGGPKAMTDVGGDVPEWFLESKSDPNYLLATNTAVSRDMQMAIDKASTGARAEIGRQAEVRISGLQKRFDEEVGVNDDAELLQMFTQASKTVVSTSLSGSRIAKKTVKKDGQFWRAYILIEYPIGAANQALMEQLKSNKRLYTRFRASETFKELEDEVKNFENWKKDQSN